MLKNAPEIFNFKAETLSDATEAVLKKEAAIARGWAVVATSVANSGHPAGALSSEDIYTLLLACANTTPQNQGTDEQDRIVVSHGHTSAGFYAALAPNGFIDPLTMGANFRRVGSAFQGHVERDVPGCDWGTGNLGQGLSSGVGFALAAKAKNAPFHTWVVLGDGEQVKGQLAEARRVAVKENLHISAIIDNNDIQISGHLSDVMPVNIEALWAADGWQVIHADGHNFKELYAAMRKARFADKPTVIIAHTIMGKGVSFMENIPDYHGKPAGDKTEQALKELGLDPSIYAQAKELRATKPAPKGREVERFVPNIDTGTPITYGPEDKKDNRGAFGKALAEVGLLNYKKADKSPILVFDCDLAGAVKTSDFKKACPDNFIEVGIQEHNTATLAGVASTAGVVAVWAEFGCFGADEVFNQQRLNDINRATTKTVLTHVGLDVGEDGMTHQCIDYVGLFNNTFGWKVFVPADPNQTDRAIRAMLKDNGNVCVAMGRSVMLPVLAEDGTPFFGGDYKFENGKIDEIRKGSDVAILAMGHVVSQAVAAGDELKAQGISVQVLHCATPLAMKAEDLTALVGNKPLLTVEDHHVATGIGAIAARLFALAGKATKIKCLGVTRYGDSGSAKDAVAAMGLDKAGILAGVKELLGK